MGLLRNSIVFVGSMFVTIASIVWGLAEGGYEPWIVAIGGIVVIAANGDRFQSLGRKKRNLTPEQRIEARDKWRPIFEDYFLGAAGNNQRVGDAIVHDVNRLDIYPDSEKEKGISSWFRVGLMGTYHRGILLGLRWTYVEKKDGEWVENQIEQSEDSVKVMLLGEVPYESIESVNFDGDDYYNKPHIYCHFDYSGEPYERLFYGEERQLDPGFPYYYSEIAKYQPGPRWKFWRRT